MTVLRLLLICILLLPAPSWAAIALSASSVESTGIDNLTSVTTSLTINANTTLLLACVTNGGSTSGGPSGVTFGGTPMTASRSDSWSGADFGFVTFFYLVNPSITTANAVASWSVAAKTNNGGGVTYIQLSGVDLTTPVEASSGASFSTPAGTLTASVTTLTDLAWVFSCAEGRNSGGLTNVGSSTLVTDRVVDNDGFGVSYRPDLPIAARAMSWTQSSDRGSISLISLKPAPTVDTSSCQVVLPPLEVGLC